MSPIRARVAILAAGLFALTPAWPSTSVAPAQDAQETEAETQSEVLVLGRKMRRVRLHYTSNGPHLRRCDVLVSSGEARIDRTMCEVLRVCVRLGNDEPPAARTCMHNRIGILEREAILPPELAEGGEADAAEPPQETVAPPPFDPEPPEEVVVTAPRLAVAPGMWAFEEQGIVSSVRYAPSFTSSRGRILRTKRWRLCIRPGEVAPTLLRMVESEPPSTVPRPCRWQLGIAGNRLEGNQRCMTRSARLTGTLEGEYSEDALIVTKHLRAKSPGGGDISSDLWFETRGKRIGRC